MKVSHCCQAIINNEICFECKEHAEPVDLWLEELKEKSAIFLEENGFDGDIMISCEINKNIHNTEDKGRVSMYVADLMAYFTKEYNLKEHGEL